MTVQVVLDSPLAAALGAAIQPKLVEVGWGTGSTDDAALAEYIVLMLINGRNLEQIAAELSSELLNLGPNDPGAREFAGWLFEQAELLNAQLNGVEPADGALGTSMAGMDADDASGVQLDTDMGAGPDASELNAPTGPRSMRNGNANRGGRDKRMLGHMSKAMDRSGDSALHRVRGNDRIGRTPPRGPRGGGVGANARGNNNRSQSIQAGLNAMAGMGGPGAMGMNAGGWPMGGAQGPSQLDLFAMLEQQSRMMEQLSQQMMNNANNGNQRGGRGGRGGRSLFDRVQHPGRNNRNGAHHAQDKGDATMGEGGAPAAEGEDVEMGHTKREPPNPDDTVCKYNLSCTNKDCKFAHQSPAAPPGVTVDVHDVCTFGAACKNRKCVGRHPSPATRAAHQSEQDCKFFPNCQNPRCPFRHPSMPLCRNGADCTTPNCKFTHVKTKCRFNPCLNPHCAFAHEEGQQGGFKDKVWTADGTASHVSERKFVDDKAEDEVIITGGDAAPEPEHHEVSELIS